MVSGVYTIYDKVAQEAGPLFLAKNDSVALRMVNQSPEFKSISLADFALYMIGTYDSESFDNCSGNMPLTNCVPHLVKWNDVGGENE